MSHTAITGYYDDSKPAKGLTGVDDLKSGQPKGTRAAADLIELAAGPMLTPAQRRALKPPCGTGPRGHVAPPGTGPAGETCGSCQHLFRNVMAKTYLKCGLNRAKWTGGGKTDIRARDHACRQWEAAPAPSGRRS